jgi:hypothetical protein
MIQKMNERIVRDEGSYGDDKKSKESKRFFFFFRFSSLLGFKDKCGLKITKDKM